MDIIELSEKAKHETDAAKAICAKAELEKRSMTALERETVQNHRAEARRLCAEIEAVTPMARQVPQAQPGSYQLGDDARGDGAAAGGEYKDLATGRVVRYWAKGQAMRTPPTDGDTYSFGRYMRALITGRKDFLNDSEQRAMSEGVNTLGGNLVPSEFSTQIIDKARNLSVVMRAGAKVVEMQTQTLDIARITTDVAYEVKAENAAFTGDEIELDRITLNAKTVGALIKSSMELAEDAINFEETVESALAEGLATELDRLALVGSGAAEPLGVTNLPEAQESLAVGSIDYDTLLDMREDLVDKNTPDDNIAFATTAALSTILSKLKSGDGTNSSAAYYNPSTISGLEGITRYTTNQAVSGEAYMWNGATVIWGVRLHPTVEISPIPGFDRNQLQIRIVFRGDFNAEHADQVVTFRGLTA